MKLEFCGIKAVVLSFELEFTGISDAPDKFEVETFSSSFIATPEKELSFEFVPSEGFSNCWSE